MIVAAIIILFILCALVGYMAFRRHILIRQERRAFEQRLTKTIKVPTDGATIESKGIFFDSTEVSYGLLYTVLSSFDKPKSPKERHFSQFSVFYTKDDGKRVRFDSPIIEKDAETLQIHLVIVGEVEVKLNPSNPNEYMVNIDFL